MTTAEAPFNINRLSKGPERLNVFIASECSRQHMSGVSRSVDEIGRYLLNNNHQVKILAAGPRSPYPDDLDAISQTTPHVKIKDFDTSVGMYPWVIKRILKREKPTVLHAASPMDFPGRGLFTVGNALVAANELNIASVAVHQTDPVRYLDHLAINTFEGLPAIPGLKTVERFTRQSLSSAIIPRVRNMHNLANINLAPSKAAQEDLVNWGVRPDSIRLWDRGVDTTMFHPDKRESPEAKALRKQWAPNGEIILGFVGRLAPEKTIERLAALKNIPNTKIVVVGKGPSKDYLREVLGDTVIFTGELRDEALATAYAAMDIFSFTSQTETFGQALQEAKAAGLPVVTPGVGGPLDLFVHAKTGFFYDDDTQFVHYVQELVKDSALRERVGKAARSSVEDRSWAIFGARIVEFYRQAIQIEAAKS